jgi:hypothetical protein
LYDVKEEPELEQGALLAIANLIANFCLRAGGEIFKRSHIQEDRQNQMKISAAHHLKTTYTDSNHWQLKMLDGQQL